MFGRKSAENTAENTSASDGKKSNVNYINAHVLR